MTYTHKSYPPSGAVATAFSAKATQRRFLIGFALFLGLLPMLAQAGTIAGRVLNGATKQYLRNAQIQIVGTDKSTISEDGGEFYFAELTPGQVTLSISYPGLDTLEKTVTVGDDVLVQEFSLTSGVYGDEALMMDVFQVATEREGNAKAIVDQKQALNFKNVVAADAFGDVTEGNVAEFLKLLPGISVDYVDADVRAVRIRGLSPKYANVTLDGHPIATSASSNIDTGRQYEFEQISLATLDIVEINKSPLADMPASGLSGSVNVRSKSAFNQKGRQIKYSFSGITNQYDTDVFKKTLGWDNQSHYKTLLNGSIEFSDTFFNDRLGVVAAYNHSGSYVDQKVEIGSYQFDRNPDNNKTETPLFAQLNFQDGLKPTWRDSFVLNLDYRATDDLTFALRTSYNYYEAPFYNRNWILNANTTGVTYNTAGDGTLTANPQILNLTPTSAISRALSTTDNNSYAQVAGTNFLKWGGTFIISPSVSWKHNNLVFDGSLSYSRSKNQYDSYAQGFFSTVTTRMQGVSWAYSRDGDGNIPIHVNQINTGASNNVSFFDLGNYRSNASVNREERNSSDQIWTANADVTIKMDDWKMPVVFKVGGDNRLNVRDIQNFNPTWTLNANPSAGGINMSLYQEAYRPDFKKGETLMDINGVLGQAPSSDKWRLYDLFRNYNTDPFATTTTAQQPFNANAGNNYRNFFQSQFDIKETIYSGYAMATVSVRKDTKVIVGLRYENTETEGRSFDDIGAARALAVSGTSDTNEFRYILARWGGRKTRTQSYDNLFPSAQVRYEPTKNLVLRAAYFASILRPDFATVTGGVSVNEGATPIEYTVKNTTLEPELANNYDIRAEYYFEPVGAVSFGAFFKDIKDIQISTRSQIDPNAIPAELTDLGINSTNLGTGAILVERMNAGNTSVWGLEASYEQQLSFLPGFWRGFGVFANATYIHPKSEIIFAMTAEDGIAKYSGNIGTTYRVGRFKGQIKANWADERLRSINGLIATPDGSVTIGNPQNNYNRREITESRLQIDANVDFKLNRYATLFASVTNIFNEAQSRVLEQEPFYSRYGTYGARYTLGVKGSF